MRLTIPDFAAARVLVLGDVMLDHYYHGDTSRISPEAPVPVVRVEEEELRPGGAGNVALNVAALGGRAELVGLTGDDPAADALSERLQAVGVTCDFARLAGCRTVTKLRVLSRHQQLIRLDFEDGFVGHGRDGVDAPFRAHLARADVVILSDYGKGTLTEPQAFIRAARDAGVPVLVDPKGHDFGRYRGASLITPNLAEFEAVAGPCADNAELEAKGENLRRELELGALLVTRSEKGMTLLRADRPPLHLPARAREVFDVTGAGDTVISVLAAALAAGRDLAEATALANLAAGVVVGKLGTATVSVEELRQALRTPEALARGVAEEERLAELVAEAKLHGERVVMTNGCFDLLHAGHVRYLAEAKAMGDRLIVAVNDDASVRRLDKGSERPLNPLAQRMAVLAALEAVDWVVPFSEDTPERLVCRLRPDVLVKGGDYRPEQIAGAACAGEVRVLGFLEGCSTSALVEKIRHSHDR